MVANHPGRRGTLVRISHVVDLKVSSLELVSRHAPVLARRGPQVVVPLGQLVRVRRQVPLVGAVGGAVLAGPVEDGHEVATAPDAPGVGGGVAEGVRVCTLGEAVKGEIGGGEREEGGSDGEEAGGKHDDGNGKGGVEAERSVAGE